MDNDAQDLHWSLDEDESTRLLDALFPDKKLLEESVQHRRLTPSGGIASVLDNLAHLYGKNAKGKPLWLGFPTSRKPEPTAENKSIPAYQKMADFFNAVIDGTETQVGPFKYKAKWCTDVSMLDSEGADVSRKPDLLLLRRPDTRPSEDFDWWRDITVFGTITSKKSSTTIQTSYAEAASYTGSLLYSQDGRHSAPISTCPPADLGFDETVFWDKELRKRRLEVAWRSGGHLGESSDGVGTDSHITLEEVIFIADALLGRGTTVWSGTMGASIIPPSTNSMDLDMNPATLAKPKHREVIVKDSWIDPLRKFTEGTMLAILNDAGVEGVPQLIHEQQVRSVHPTRASSKPKLNLSTHTLRALLAGHGATVSTQKRPYELRVLSRLVTEPEGLLLFPVSAARVVLLTSSAAHRDAVEKASVLHRDISLLNLLLVGWDNVNMDRRSDFLNHLPTGTRELLRSKLKNLPHRGLLADWGCAVPIAGLSAHSSPFSVTETVNCEAVPVRRSSAGAPGPGDAGTDTLEYIALSELKHDDEIMLLMGRDSPPADHSQPSIDTNPLHRIGTWSWMAAELLVAGPNTPVVHKPHHDLESFFYVLLGICVLYDEPHKPKPDAELKGCFDKYFNTFTPSLLRTGTIQSNLTWGYCISAHISAYFRPLIPLLEFLRERIVGPMEVGVDGAFRPTAGHITHEEMVRAFVDVLCGLEDGHWGPGGDRGCVDAGVGGSRGGSGTCGAGTPMIGPSEDLSVPADLGRGGVRSCVDAGTDSAGINGSTRRRISDVGSPEIRQAKRQRR
ncbi:hypothetical protein HYDPIDRAFT_25878 [Hydnomerulius pinastri MD-312]|nr:hypothetical protein HYDPIDRAFT_25878 [Hydnomerulius pinastri MD-312]